MKSIHPEMVKYKHCKPGTLSTIDFSSFLKNVDNEFVIPLSNRLVIDQYSEKLTSNSEIFLALNMKGVIIGCAAVYLNDFEMSRGYIPLVAVEPDYQRKGISKELLKQIIYSSSKRGFKFLELEVVTSSAAYMLYSNYGFNDIEKYDRNNIRSSKMELIL